jgi:hypothetical protein
VVTSSSDSIAVTSFTRKNGTFQVDLKNSSNENQYIEVPLAYYPVYKAILNESTVLKISKGDNNVVKIEIPANSEGKVIVKYHKQLTWLLADTLSAITLLVLVLNYLYKSKYKMRISK